jgi:hypothetical protein
MSVPLLGDISLEFVQQIEHWHDSGFVSTRIAGLPGELQQHSGRLSHRIRIVGILYGDKAADSLKSLQQAAAAGDELAFSADITSALDLQKIVITSMRAVEVAGQVNRFSYEIQLTESPPLPPPAEISSFGGLDDFGVGDLGFDADIMGDLQDVAGQVAGAVDQALDVVSQLGALGNLDGLQLTDFMAPMGKSSDQVGKVATQFKDALRGLNDLFS